MKILASLLMLLMIGSSSIAGVTGNIYMEVTKAVNGSQVYGLPVLEVSILKEPLLVDIEFRNNFTSARGKIGIPNHLSSELNVHMGVQQGTWFGTFSLGPEVVYAGNDEGLPSGIFFKNTLRVGASF